MFNPAKFTTTKPKPLPVCLLLDISGSMYGDRIDELNQAVRKMLTSLAEEEKMETEILVSVISFGSEVKIDIPYTKASQVEWTDLQVSGMTPMGKALKMAKEMIENKEITPSRAYRPTIVLISDGGPNDSWEQPLEDFINDGRSSKCDRMAMAIGSGADKNVLTRFIQGTEHNLFTADNAAQLHEFFQRVTMSVTMRTRSKNPNVIPLAIEYQKSSEEITAEPLDEEIW